MSALGQKQTYAVQNGMSALPPESGHVQRKPRCLLRANSGHKLRRYLAVNIVAADGVGGLNAL